MKTIAAIALIVSQIATPALAGGCGLFKKRIFAPRVFHQEVIHEVCQPQVQQFHYFGAPSVLPEFQANLAIGTLERQLARVQDQFAALQQYQAQYAAYQQPPVQYQAAPQPYPAQQYVAQPQVYAQQQTYAYQQQAPVQYAQPQQYAPPQQYAAPQQYAEQPHPCATCQQPMQQQASGQYICENCYPVESQPQQQQYQQPNGYAQPQQQYAPLPHEQGYAQPQYQEAVPAPQQYNNGNHGQYDQPQPQAPQYQAPQQPQQYQVPPQQQLGMNDYYAQRQGHGSIVRNACASCHQGPTAKGGIDFTNLASLTQEQRVNAVEQAAAGVMPKGGRPMNQQEVQLLARELGVQLLASSSPAQ